MMAKRELFGDLAGEGQTKRGKKEMDPIMMMRYDKIRRQDEGVPIVCDCSAAIRLATCNSPTQRGQRYFSCPYEISDGPCQGCGFKRWWEPALLDKFAKIKEEKKEMQQCLDEAHTRINEQEVMIVEMQSQYAEVLADMKQLDDYNCEMFETQIGLAQAMDKHGTLERRFEALERKYESLNKYL